MFASARTCEAHSVAAPPQMVRAVEHIRRMRGGAQAHLLRCSDGGYYVVKFQNNPQHRRVLVNELLGTKLAARLAIRLALPRRPARADAARFSARRTVARSREPRRLCGDAGVRQVDLQH